MAGDLSQRLPVEAADDEFDEPATAVNLIENALKYAPSGGRVSVGSGLGLSLVVAVMRLHEASIEPAGQSAGIDCAAPAARRSRHSPITAYGLRLRP